MIFPEPPKSTREVVLSQVFAPIAENYPWLTKERTIFLTLHGSHAHGMAREGSDTDVKGICIPPKDHYLGLRLEKSMFQQAERHEPIDLVIYELQKFLRLAANCNPTIIEILFTETKHHLHVTDIGRMLLDHRKMFISKRAKWSFGQYAKDQLNKIKRHRAWIGNPPSEGEPDWVPYQEHLSHRNPARLELEKKFGYDTKHAVHLVRLLRMALEIVMDGVVAVDRRTVGGDADELLSIKDGQWSYERLLEWTDNQYRLIEQAYESSGIPGACDMNAVEALSVKLTELMLESDLTYG